jgi:hypothetical protein
MGGKTYPRALDVLAQGGPQLLDYPVKFPVLGSCESLLCKIPDLIFARHSSAWGKRNF